MYGSQADNPRGLCICGRPYFLHALLPPPGNEPQPQRDREEVERGPTPARANERMLGTDSGTTQEEAPQTQTIVSSYSQ